MIIFPLKHSKLWYAPPVDAIIKNGDSIPRHIKSKPLSRIVTFVIAMFSILALPILAYQTFPCATSRFNSDPELAWTGKKIWLTFKYGDIDPTPAQIAIPVRVRDLHAIQFTTTLDALALNKDIGTTALARSVPLSSKQIEKGDLLPVIHSSLFYFDATEQKAKC